MSLVMPNLIVDLDKLEHNIQFIKAFCEHYRDGGEKGGKAGQFNAGNSFPQ